MGNPSKDLLEAESTLRVLIQHLLDDQEGLQTMAEDVQDETLKLTMLAESLKRAEFRGDLESLLHQEGVRDIKEEGTPEGKFLKVWTQLKAKFGAGDHGLVSAAAEGEQTVVEAYADALKKDLPLPIREVVEAQAEKIQATYEVLCIARDRAA